VPSSLVDEPSGGKTPDVPTGENMTNMTCEILDNNLTILDCAGYILTAKSTLRLKVGGGGDEGEASGSAYNTPSYKDKPAACLIKRKRLGEDSHSPDQEGSPCPHAIDFEKYSDEVSVHIGDTRAILEVMIVQT